MLFYITLFLLFLYFKIARVHYRNEKLTSTFIIQHTAVIFSAMSVFLYGFTHHNPYAVGIVSFLYFMIAALMITALQVGIFKDGVPLLGLSRVYKNLPYLTTLIVVFSVFATSENFL